MPGPQLTRDDLNSLLIFENLCNEWVREVHRFTSERKKKKNFVIFRSVENKKLTSLDELKEELEDVSFLENTEFKSAFSHNIVSNKVGANKRARRAAKAWMADPKKQISDIAQVATPVEETAPVVEEVRIQEATPLVEESIEESAPYVEEAKISEESSLAEESIEDSAPDVEDSIKVTPIDETENSPEETESFEEVMTPNIEVIKEEDIAAPLEEQVIPAVEQKATDTVVEEVAQPVVDEKVTPAVDVEEEATSSFEEITVPAVEEVTVAAETENIVPKIEELVAPVEEVLILADEEQSKAPEEEPLVVENVTDEEISIVDVEEDTNTQDITAPLDEDDSTPAVEEATTTIEETKEAALQPAEALTNPSEAEQVITPASEETDLVEEKPSIDKDEMEDIKEEPVLIVKAETERGDSVLSDTSEMGSMESLEARTDSASTNSDEDNENSCSDTDIFITTSDVKQKDDKVEDIKIEIVQVL